MSGNGEEQDGGDGNKAYCPRGCSHKRYRCHFRKLAAAGRVIEQAKRPREGDKRSRREHPHPGSERRRRTETRKIGEVTHYMVHRKDPSETKPLEHHCVVDQHLAIPP